MQQARPVALVVEDEPSVRTSLVAYLEDSGWTANSVSSGSDALRSLARQQPDAVLLDLRLPNLDGLEVLRVLHRESPETPVIVISGKGLLPDAVESLRLGAWDYLTKPIDDLATLGAALERALERRQLMLEVRQHREKLECQVRERTEALEAANQALEEKALALRAVLDTIQEGKREAQKSVVGRIESTVMPLLQRARESAPPATRAILCQIEQNLSQLAHPFMDHLSRRFANLTPSELRICMSIRRGLSSKEIAQAEGIAPETVDTHRKNIRRKLQITNENVNLATYLNELEESGTSAPDALPKTPHKSAANEPDHRPI